LLLTEAGTKRRAAIHFLRGRAALVDLDPGGLEVLDATLARFTEVLARENHTLKTLEAWTVRLRKERAGSFREKVTAFREDMAVHGKYGKPWRP
jgi:formamidopyrimidine-DNA glycosylase